LNGAVNQRVRIENNRFFDFEYRQSRCTLGEEDVREGMSRRECQAAGGAFQDGHHPDAIQLWRDEKRGPTSDITVIGNDINVDGQGIGTYGGRGAPATNWRVENNKVHTSRFTNIFIHATDGVIIRNNEVARWPGSRRPFPNIVTRGATNVINCGNRMIGARPAQEGGRPCTAKEKAVQ
ncbi:MAG: hypothetical protein SNJ79_14035, partial [Sphingomonadaceae bacterium]